METIGAYKARFLAGPMTWAFCIGEMQELREAIAERDAAHAWEEWNDVTLCLLAWASEHFPVLGWMPILPGLGLLSAEKFAARISVWEDIFEHHGVQFRKEHLFAGSNYRKAHKVVRVLGLGGVEESDVDLEWVEKRVGGFEPGPGGTV